MNGGYQTVMFGAGTVGTIIGGALAESSGRLPYLVCAAVYAAVLAASVRRVRGLDAQPAPAPVVLPNQGHVEDQIGLGAVDGVAAGEVVD